MTHQLTWADISIGDALPPTSYPLTVHRLILAAGSTRDFTATHHNASVATAAGSPGMFASAILLQGMWERTLRDWMGPAGTITAIRSFRMRAVTPAGTTASVTGVVLSKSSDPGGQRVTVELRTTANGALVVGPGEADITLP